MAEATWEDLKDALRINTGGSVPDALIEQCFNVSKAYVDNYVGTQTVPEVTTNEAYINGGQEVFKRRNAPQGQAQTVDATGAPLPYRLSKDPFITTRELLKPYLVVGF